MAVPVVYACVNCLRELPSWIAFVNKLFFAGLHETILSIPDGPAPGALIRPVRITMEVVNPGY